MTRLESDDELKLFSRLFSGYEKAHGHYEINRSEDGGKKLGKAVTQPRPASLEDYSRHLRGAVGIGIVPLTLQDNCWFGAIDVDIKGSVKLKETHKELEAKIRKYKLPLMLFHSKSNGAHLYLFAKDNPISARLMQNRLMEFAALLGYGGCEIFPKQITRLQPEDVGNWINLPLFGDERKGLFEGKELDKLTSLRTCDYLSITEDELRAFNVAQNDFFKDGPPCLQQIMTLGIGEGNRNNTLFNVAVYLDKKHGEDWPEKLIDFNDEYVDPPLPKSELVEIQRNLNKKGYNYTCKAEPICSFCDRKKCRTRAYGVNKSKDGSETDEHFLLPINGLIKYVAGDGQSYQWHISTSDGIIRYSTEEFLSLEMHRKKFLEKLNIIIPTIKEKDFRSQLQAWVAKAEIVYDPEDASEEGQLIHNVESWFTDKGSARNADEMIKHRWWRNPINGFVYFMGASLEDYLIHQKKMRGINKHKLWRLLVEKFNTEQDKLLIKGKRRRVCVIKNFEIEEKTPLEVPDISRKEQEI